ncbi:MAG: type II toxin-antitoxin system ParD family antitoxin [Gammaproteobacteria bacterium]|nr:type II toxin-antitoxin system ParD family antitoxin [Gammaproteobacteria bacterium]MDE0508609.1 type II toxin-antitoxin system ParD family antitoxin [Gammaproteobacteria bacterium]
MKYPYPKRIHRDQPNKSQIEAIRAALIEGEQSGKSQPFDPEQFKQEMREKHNSGTA